ncbi:MAG: zinc ribbon domain-containing protein [Oligoflexales bacterium]|nr:zinc ribbon domain-containing protein [Oligoflexales bacterium]
MPIYEFKCKHCGITYEEMMKMSDPNPESCPKCLKGPVEKLLSRSNFVLKGGGWYTTDFKTQEKSPDRSDRAEEKTSPVQPSCGANSADNCKAPACAESK